MLPGVLPPCCSTKSCISINILKIVVEELGDSPVDEVLALQAQGLDSDMEAVLSGIESGRDRGFPATRRALQLARPTWPVAGQ